MTDTSHQIEQMIASKWASRSAEERFIRGVLMFDAAREMVLASFPKNLSKKELKRLLIRRFYPELQGDKFFPTELIV